jgi:hypothetical protein
MGIKERRCRFVQGDVVRLALSGGEWIDVKKELNAGESRRIFATLVKEMHAGQPTKLDPEKVGLTKVVEYVVGWSLLGSDDRPEPVSESAIDGLDLETYREIVDAVDAHDAACDAERLARKNGQAGEKASAAISPSPDAAGGASIGFDH